MSSQRLIALCLLMPGLLLILGSSKPQQPAPPKDLDASLRQKVLSAAQEYKKYGIVDPDPHWGPTMCRAPSLFPRLSDSSDSKTHGQKLYFVYARQTRFLGDQHNTLKTNKLDELDLHFNTRTYLPRGKHTRPGQVIVKEAWTPKGVPAETFDDHPDVKDYPNHYLAIQRGDTVYYPHRKSALFLMLKLDVKTPNTDQGWLYATVTPDAKKVLSMGRLENCMGCHQRAPVGRLFGLPGHAERNKPPKVKVALNDPRFHDQLLDVAKRYKKLHPVSAEVFRDEPGCVLRIFEREEARHVPNFSDNKEADHGSTLGYHYASKVNKGGSYLTYRKAVPVGQVVVKEAFEAQPYDPTLHFDVPTAAGSGRVYRAGDKVGLFVMLKLDPKTPGTDRGWVYGKLSPDGKKVLSSGKAASCMECHKTSKLDRLFGIGILPITAWEAYQKPGDTSEEEKP